MIWSTLLAKDGQKSLSLRIVWTLTVLASITLCFLFIYNAAENFLKSTVVTTIHSTTVPLSEVYFPAVTVCNINQVSTKLKLYFINLICLLKKLCQNKALVYFKRQNQREKNFDFLHYPFEPQIKLHYQFGQ